MRKLFLVAGLLMLAACGSGNNGTPNATPSTMSDGEILAIGKQLAQCIRDNGVPGLPEPYVEKGRLKLPEEQLQQIESQYSDQVIDQAMQACKSIVDKLPDGALNEGGDDGDERRPGPGDVEAIRKFAQCVRENGIPEFPDPKADGTIPLRGTPLEAEGKSERLGAAFQACRKHWEGGLAIS
jgi:hypothetical protein